MSYSVLCGSLYTCPVHVHVHLYICIYMYFRIPMCKLNTGVRNCTQSCLHMPCVKVILCSILLCRSCENDEALYTAFNLSSLFDVRMEVLNTTEVKMDGILMQQHTCTCTMYAVALRMWVCFEFTLKFFYPDILRAGAAVE